MLNDEIIRVEVLHRVLESRLECVGKVFDLPIVNNDKLPDLEVITEESYPSAVYLRIHQADYLAA